MKLGLVLFGLVALAGLGGCAGDEESGPGSDSLDATGGKIRPLKEEEKLGELAYGEMGEIGKTDALTGYAGYSFQAKKGDIVEAWVRSHDADPKVWITRASGTILAKGDDSELSTDAHVTAEIKSTGTYWLIFKPKKKGVGSYEISLQNLAAPAKSDNLFNAAGSCVGTPLTASQVRFRLDGAAGQVGGKLRGAMRMRNCVEGVCEGFWGDPVDLGTDINGNYFRDGSAVTVLFDAFSTPPPQGDIIAEQKIGFAKLDDTGDEVAPFEVGTVHKFYDDDSAIVSEFAVRSMPQVTFTDDCLRISAAGAVIAEGETAFEVQYVFQADF